MDEVTIEELSSLEVDSFDVTDDTSFDDVGEELGVALEADEELGFVLEVDEEGFALEVVTEVVALDVVSLVEAVEVDETFPPPHPTNNVNDNNDNDIIFFINTPFFNYILQHLERNHILGLPILQ